MAEDQAPAPAASAGKDVFVSYASQDAAVANAVVASLESSGVTCWIAPRDVRPGTVYADAIVGAINESKALVLVLSAHAMPSAHVGREVERAASKRKQLIALRMDTTPLTRELEYFLSNSQWIDAPALGMPQALARLRDAVGPAPTKEVNPGSSAHPASPANTHAKRIAVAAGFLVLGLSVTWGLRFWPTRHADAQAPAVAATPTGAIPDKSIAVLPFVDMSANKDQEYFADGIAEEILDLLARIPALKVIGRTSSFQFKGHDQDLRTIGTTLGVAYVLEGSVRTSGNRLRITAQLIKTSDGTHLWSDTYDREMGDVLRMQDEIAAALVRALEITARADDLQSRSTLTNIDSYNLYLRGRYAFDRFDAAGFEDAAQYFEEALKVDPTAAAAAAWLSFTRDVQGEWGFVAPQAAFEQARTTAKRALALNPRLSLAQSVLGSIHTVYDWDWAAAEDCFKRALALSPGDPYVLAFASRLSMSQGRLDKALSEIDESLSLDPLLPTNYILLSWIQLRRDHLHEAAAAARRALDISPTYVGAHYYLGLTLLAQNQPADALAAMQREVLEGGQLGALAIAYASLGRKSDSDKALAEMLRREANDNAYGIAAVYAFRHEPEAALRWLERAHAQHDSTLYTIKGDLPFRALEPDPRFRAFLGKMNLPQ